MEQGWIEVYNTGYEYKASMARELLESGKINSVVINRQDSVIKTVGEYSIYVAPDNQKEAVEFLKELTRE